MAFWVERRVAEAAAVAGLAADMVTGGKASENVSVPKLQVRTLPGIHFRIIPVRPQCFTQEAHGPCVAQCWVWMLGRCFDATITLTDQ